LWSSRGKFCSYRSYSDGGEEMKHLEMKHFLIGFLCVFVGVVTGVLLSEAVISPFLPGTETLMAKNGLVILYH
jgi:hypothetical protein